MRQIKKQTAVMALLLLVVCGVPLTGWAAIPTWLYAFNGTLSDGAWPNGSLTLSGDGTKLYGMTKYGGTSDKGTIFSVDTGNNNEYTTLHSFTLAGDDGELPVGSLTLSGDGTKLFGMTPEGGSGGMGAAFMLDPSNNQYTTIHSFTSNNGFWPYGSLILSGDGTTLYGMTSEGGAGGAGVIFSINLGNNNQYAIIHSFTGTDGAMPNDSLTLSGDGTKLYGMTAGGGASGEGVVFSIDLGNNNQYTTLHSFTWTGTDGAMPYGSLTFSGDGTKLYGMTSEGGASSNGVVFSIDLRNNNQYTTLHSFTGSDGSYPIGSLTLAGDHTTLYGMTSDGGTTSNGVIFSIVPGKSNQFTALYDFSGSPYGALPNGSFILSDDKLYGMTSKGGNGYGEVFSFPVTATSTPSPTACTATLDENLLLHIPFISYTDPTSEILWLWADFDYDYNPTFPQSIIFTLVSNAPVNTPSLSCAAATLSISSSDVGMHIPDLLLPDGITHLWADMEYSSYFSTNGNICFVVTNYGSQ